MVIITANILAVAPMCVRGNNRPNTYKSCSTRRKTLLAGLAFLRQRYC